MNEPLLTTREAAELLGVKENTLSIWRNTDRHHIPYIKIGRAIRYKRSDLVKFLSERTTDD